LEAELSRVSEARAELDGLIQADAQSLAALVRSGASYVLNRFAGSRAQSLSAKLSDSRLEAQVGSQALAAIAADVLAAEREISDLKSQKADAIMSVLVEASAGWHADMAVLVDDLRQILTVLAAVDKITTRSNGEWSPNERLVVTLPALGGLPQNVVVVPGSAVEKAKATLKRFAADLDKDPLAGIDELKFDHFLGNEDAGIVPYESLHPAERKIVDQENAGTRLGVH
jgi:hypothetical protein